MRIPHRLQCLVCGEKSEPVDPVDLSPRNRQMLAEFRDLHVRCADALVGFAREHAVESRPDGWAPPQCGPFGSVKADPKSAPRPHGHCEYTGPYGEIQEVDTISCCHCRKHWEFRAGVEKRLGFCAMCYNGTPGSGTTCGRPECLEHVPFLQRLENIEAGLPMLTPKAPQVTVPAGFAGGVLLEPPASTTVSAIDTSEV